MPKCTNYGNAKSDAITLIWKKPLKKQKNNGNPSDGHLDVLCEDAGIHRLTPSKMQPTPSKSAGLRSKDGTQV